MKWEYLVVWTRSGTYLNKGEETDYYTGSVADEIVFDVSGNKHYDIDDLPILKAAQKLGKMGWELTTSHHPHTHDGNKDATSFWFKRPIKTSK